MPIIRPTLLVATFGLTVSLLGACAAPGQQSAQIGDSCGSLGWKSIGGGLIGGAAGGLAGNQFGKGSGNSLMTALGALGGMAAGAAAGSSMDRSDCMFAQRAQTAALETTPIGRPVAWQNPDNGNHGTFVPTRTYEPAPGRYCREYQQTIVIGGQAQQGVGTACRQPDGTWKVES